MRTADWFDLWIVHQQRRRRKGYPMRSCLYFKEDPHPTRREIINKLTGTEYRKSNDWPHVFRKKGRRPRINRSRWYICLHMVLTGMIDVE